MDVKLETLVGEFTTKLTEFTEFRKKLDSNNVEHVERLGKMDLAVSDLGKKMTDEIARRDAEAATVKAEMLTLKQRGWRMPGAEGGDGGAIIKPSYGAQFATSDEFKNAQFNGRFRFQWSTKSRLFERKAITEAGSGWVMYPTRVGIFPTTPQPPLVMRDLLPVVPLTVGNAVEYVLETWTYNADYQIAEGDKKAEGSVAFTDKTAVVRTIAWFVKVSRQMLADVPYIQQTIDQRLIYGVLKKEDHEILYGDGLAGHIHGIMPQVAAMVIGTPPDNRIDELATAITSLTAAGYPPTGIVLNPMDWGGIQISKTPTGMYYLGGPPQAEAQPRLWGLPVVVTPEMTLADFLVGAFSSAAALFDRETATTEISFENEDDFVRNLATIRAEERITLAVYQPQAFVRGPFSVATRTAGGAPSGQQGRTESGRVENGPGIGNKK